MATPSSSQHLYWLPTAPQGMSHLSSIHPGSLFADLQRKPSNDSTCCCSKHTIHTILFASPWPFSLPLEVSSVTQALLQCHLLRDASLSHFSLCSPHLSHCRHLRCCGIFVTVVFRLYEAGILLSTTLPAVALGTGAALMDGGRMNEQVNE